MPLDFRLIEVVSSIVRLGSFSKAAEELYVSQPALSQYIRRIERELGYPIFTRDKKKCSPTPAGKILAQRGEFLLKYREDMLQDMSALSTADNETVRLGMANGYTRNYLSATIDAVYRHHPNIHLVPVEEYTNKLLELLRARKVDLIIVPIPPDVPGFTYHPIHREELCVGLAADHPANQFACTENGIDFIELRNLQDIPFILVKDAPRFTDFCSLFFQEANISPTILFQPDNWQTCDAMASAGIGATLVPAFVAEHSKNQNRYYHIKSRFDTYRILTIAHLEGQVLSASAKQVLEQIETIFGDELVGYSLAELDYTIPV